MSRRQAGALTSEVSDNLALGRRLYAALEACCESGLDFVSSEPREAQDSTMIDGNFNLGLVARHFLESGRGTIVP